MSTLRRCVYSRLDPADYRHLQQEAAARGVSLVACIADCLREYFALRAEMTTAVTAPGAPGGPHTGLIHSLVARSEGRLMAMVNALTTELGDEQRRLEGMLDRFVQLYLLHTPEVARELQAGAVASAHRRYAKYREAVNELRATGDGNDRLASGHDE